MKLEITVENAIKIQQQHLARWQQVLLPEVFSALKTWAESQNAGATAQWEIRRGDDLSHWVMNYPNHKIYGGAS